MRAYLLVLSNGTRGEWHQFSETPSSLYNGDDNPHPPRWARGGHVGVGLGKQPCREGSAGIVCVSSGVL